MDAMLRYIHQNEKRLSENPKSRLSRFATQCKLFFLYLTFALHRGVVLLFAHPSKSFVLVHAQDESGVWNASYDEHVRFQHNVRFFSASTMCVLLTSIAIVWSVLNLVFPQGYTPFAYAAVNTFTVSNGNDAGAGSLRQALIDANGSGPGDTNNIQFTVIGQPTILLVSGLPLVGRHIEFVNPNAAIAVVIDGTAIGLSDCLTLGAGSSNSIIMGVAFKNCNTAIDVTGNVANVLIGNDVDPVADRVQIWNGNTGIAVNGGANNSTIKNVVIGQNLADQLRPLTGTGININASFITVTKSQVGKTVEGIRLQGNNNVVKKSFIGIANIPVADVNISNSSVGIFIQGNFNTIGGSVDADKNIISNNLGPGVTIQNAGGNNNKILKNYIGLNIAGTADAGNTHDGVFISNAGTNFVGDAVLQVGPVISGNGDRGVSVANATAVVSNTIIGLSADQTVAIANAGGGVNVSNITGSPTSMSISQSVVAGNGNTGIFIGPNTTGDLLGNFIGTNDTQTITFANAFGNVAVLGSNTNIGDTGKGNVIVGSTGTGISLNNAGGTLNVVDNTISDNSFEGLNASTLLAGSILTVQNNTFDSNGGTGNIKVNTTANVTITQNTVTGGGVVDTHGIKLIDVTNATVDNNTLSANALTGILLEGLGSANVHDNDVQTSGNGIALAVVHDGTWNIHDNTTHNNVDNGIYVNASLDTAIITLDSNTANQNGTGILSDNTPNVTITNNTVAQNTEDGVNVNGQPGIDIEGNTVTDNGLKGIEVTANADNATVLSNTVSGSGQNGIHIANSDNTIVGNTSGGANTIVSSVGAGVMLDNLTNSCHVAGNFIGTNNSGDVLGNLKGVQDAGTNNTVNNNTFANNTGAGIYIEGADGDYLDNTITASGVDGILVTTGASGSIIQGNFIGVAIVGGVTVASPNLSNGIKVHNGATNITIGGVGAANTIADNGIDGVFISGAPTQGILVTQNSIYSNGNLGIELQDGANNGIQTPVIGMATINATLGTGGYEGGKVELFANGIYVGIDDTIGADGKWSVASDDYLQPANDLIGQDITATNIDTLSDTSEFAAAQTLAELSIDITPTVSTTETTATVDVTTDPKTTAKIFYGLTNDALLNEIDDDTLSTAHSFDLSLLDPDTTYYYRVDVVAEDTTAASTAVLSFVTGTVTVEASSSVTETTATIDVTTDPATTAEVSYGLSSDALTTTVNDDTLSTSHSFDLSDLTAGTTYYYRVDATTAESATASTDVLSFTTDSTPPNPGAITISTHVTTAEVAATIDVTTDPATTAEVSYGLSSDALTTTVNDDTLSTSHSFDLSGLTAGTTYYYRVDVTAEDATTASSDVKTFITTDIDFGYATTNTSVNGQKVYNPATNLYVAPGGVRLKIFPANSSHDVRLTVRDQDKNIVLQGDWQHVTNQKFVQVMEGLQKNQEYTVHAQARISTNTDTESEKQKIATVTLTRKAPTITSLTGDYTVTTNSQKIEFSGLAGTQPSSQFRFQNAETGTIVYSCGNPCTLPFALSAGVYNVLYESLNQNGVPSAPASHTLVVTPTKTTTVLNTDPRNDVYINRVVTASHATVVGLGPQDATASVYVNGTKVGEATYTTAIGWQYDLDVSGLAHNQKQLLEVKYTKAGVAAGVTVYYPFLTADSVSTPTVSGIAAEYEKGAVFTFTVAATKGDHVNVFRSGTLVFSANNTTGTLEVPVLTDAFGTQTLTVQAEDSIGLKSGTATASYDVVSAITGTTQTPPPDEGGTTVTPPPDNGGTTPPPDNGGTTPPPDNGGVTPPPDNGGTTPPPDTGDTTIPLEYRTPVTDPVQVAQLKTTLEKQNISSVLVSAEERIVDVTTGEILDTKTIAKNALGEQILRRVTVQGITANVPFFSSVFNFLKQQPSDVLVLSGETEPYALVTVTIHSDPIVQVTRADSDGKWTMTVPADALPAGEHTAFVQTDSRSVKSDQVEIAKFVVVEQKTISNTTWIFVVNLGIAIVLLLVAITLQIRGKRKPPVQKFGPTKPAPKKPVVTPKSDPNDDTPNYHNALGV